MTPIGALQYPILRMRLLHRFTFARSLIRGAAVAALCVQALAQAPAQALAQTWIAQPSGTNASLRGVSAVSPAVVWASGAGGAYLRTLDGGATWQSGLVPGAADLDFRGVQALDGQTAWLMSSGPGEKSRIYMTADAGGHWSPLYTNPDAKGFFDAVAFWDARRGVVLGDPVEGQFVILTTGDGGHTWQRRKLPAALPNEGAFAASNSCLRVRIVRGEREVWFGTGGPSGARMFHSRDGGLHWDVADTPLRHDGPGAGIFSLCLASPLRAVAVGGDYGKPADGSANVAVTLNGRDWVEPAGPHPRGYRSAVAYLPRRKVWIAVGTSGSDISRDGGNSWTPFDSGAYNAIGTGGADAAWAVGPGGRIGKLHFK
jgi:photosystem II stability/assembly factor-like uncharacterized protein